MGWMVKSPINCRVYDVTQLNPLCGFILLRRDYDDVKVEMDIVICQYRRAIRTYVHRWHLAATHHIAYKYDCWKEPEKQVLYSS